MDIHRNKKASEDSEQEIEANGLRAQPETKVEFIFVPSDLINESVDRLRLHI